MKKVFLACKIFERESIVVLQNDVQPSLKKKEKKNKHSTVKVVEKINLNSVGIISKFSVGILTLYRFLRV